MSTRINPDFYGAENTFVNNSGTTYAKHSAYSLGDLMSSGKYTGGSLDTTATPWGIGKSSLSSDYWAFLTKGDIWTYNHGENERKNSPLYLYYSFLGVTGSGSSGQFEGSQVTAFNFTSGCYKNRIYPAVEYDSRFKSTLDIDEGDTISLTNSETVNPITYADYQHLRAYVGSITYIPTEGTTLQTTTLPNLLNGTTTNISKIVRVNWGVIDTDNHNSNINFSVGGSERDIPALFKQCYYGDEATWVRPCRFIYDIGLWTSDWYVFNTGDCSYTSSFETVTDSNVVYPYKRTTAWGSASETEQVFDDISYKWVYGFCKTSSTSVQSWSTPIETGELYDATSLYGGVVYLDCGEEATPQDYAKAILHEIAFLGLPFITQRTDYTKPIGDNDVFLPVFDEHLITTGEYLSGTASLNLDNATWTDIFSDEMPDYDPEYEPEPPEPGEDDQGDLSNSYPNRYSNAGGLAQWVVSQSVLIQLAAFLNGSYLPTSADLDADFKGTNPIDYIVSVQKYPFTLPNVGNSSDIYIGKQNTSLQGKKLFPDFGGISPIAINSASTFDFGSISIPYYFNDFRDYQSKIYLFMPFIGTDELDPRLYIGHALSLVYRVDYNTGSVIAEIKRDGLTMETKNGTISITVPFLAANMGAYQNQLAQLSYSKDMTKIKGIGTALSAGFTMAAGASGTLSSGQFPLAAASNLTQAGVQLAANATQLSQLDYQIEHTAPQLGTISTAGAATAFFMDDRARIIIARPKMLDGYNSTQYSHTIGNACCKTGTLSAFSGYTQAATAILDDVHTKKSNRQATEQERQLLRRALQNGIYL